MNWRPELAPVIATRSGARAGDAPASMRQVIVDFAGSGALPQVVEASASSGRIEDPVVHARPDGGWRVGFGFMPDGDRSSELRLRLLRDGAEVSETWLYRWNA